MKKTRTSAALLALVALLALSACGEEGTVAKGIGQQSAEAETEAVYVDVDRLKYQIQLSRQMNPDAVEDRSYFVGLSEEDRQLGSDEQFFGIWMRVENDSEDPIPNAVDFEIHDTQDNVYTPLRLGEENVFAYRPDQVPADETYPRPDAAAYERAPQGAFMLFKLKRFTIENRPLEFFIKSRISDQEAVVLLDV